MHYEQVYDPQLARKREELMAQASGAITTIQSVLPHLGSLQSRADYLVGGAPSGIDIPIIGNIGAARAALERALLRAQSDLSKAHQMSVYREVRVED